jgi:hypothetical protein
MNIQQLLLLLLASVLMCEAKDGLRSQGRYLSANSSAPSSTAREEYPSNSPVVSNVTYAAHTDDETDDKWINPSGSLPAEEVGSTDDSAASDADSNPSSSSPPNQISLDDGFSLFTPPDEVEPPYWKEFVTGLFSFLALVLFALTARKTCCRNRGYQEIPSTTLIV